MKQFLIFAIIAVFELQTIVTTSPPKNFHNIHPFFFKNRAVHYREARSSEDKTESLQEANLEAKATGENVQQLGRYITYPVGSPPDKVYANSDFVSYGTNCEMGGYDLYAISGVTDILRCGNEYCNGDRRCSHFVYRISDSTCFIKNRFGYGTASWVGNREGYICGIVPSRACNVNAGSTANLLGCLSLNF